MQKTNLTEKLTASEAVFGFAGWLTTRKEAIILSYKHNCAPIADLIQQFCDENDLDEPRDNYADYLKHPKDEGKE